MIAVKAGRGNVRERKEEKKEPEIWRTGETEKRQEQVPARVSGENTRTEINVREM